MNQKPKLSIEKEIANSEARIKERTEEFESKADKLDSKIQVYTRWVWGFVIAGFVLAFFGLYIYFSSTPETYGLNLLGDYFGGALASVWSLAGLFLIYVAFLGQKQQLLHQQIEIMHSQLEVKYTRLELKGQKREMKEQNKTLRQQKFDNTFFQLLNTHSNIVNSMDLREKKGQVTIKYEGRNCFNILYKWLEKFIKRRGKDMLLNPNEAGIKDTLDGYLDFYYEHQNVLGHYFRNLYHIIKFVDKSNIEDKKTYTNFVRAQLSSHELVLLYYNCLTGNGIEKFKPLIEEYALLKNMDDFLLFNPEHRYKYESYAFGGK